MRWTTRIRIVYQAFFLVVFLWLLARLAGGDPRAFPYSAYLHGDPLSAVGVTLAAGTLPGALIWALVVIALTLLFGRVFCGWICPLGTLQQLSSWLLSPRSRRESLQVNRYRRWYALKSYILAALLVAALAGTLQSGLLDPISLTARGLAAGLWPVLPGGRPVPGGWLAALLLLAIVVASRWIPRVFCRGLCPLGALLGVFSRFAVFRIHRTSDACNNCKLCAFACQGADEPLGNHRVSECHVCLNCLPGCPEQAMTYRALPPLPVPPPKPDPWARSSTGSTRRSAWWPARRRRSSGPRAWPGWTPRR
jgi:polyferredoxin